MQRKKLFVCLLIGHIISKVKAKRCVDLLLDFKSSKNHPRLTCSFCAKKRM